MAETFLNKPKYRLIWEFLDRYYKEFTIVNAHSYPTYETMATANGNPLWVSLTERTHWEIEQSLRTRYPINMPVSDSRYPTHLTKFIERVHGFS